MGKLVAVLVVLTACVACAGPVFEKGDRVAFIGDSITAGAHGHPWGYINLLKEAQKALGREGEWTYFGLGRGGWHVYSWHHEERASVKNPALPSRDPSAPTLGEIFTNRLDVIVVSLGVNDNGFPTFGPGEKGLDAWEGEYDRFLGDLKDRCHPRAFVLGLITILRCDAENPMNGRIRKMNDRIRRLAKKYNATVVDFNTAAWEILGRARAFESGYREIRDGVHPNELGHAAMAVQFCRDVGENELAAWLEKRREDVFARQKKEHVKGPKLVARLVNDRKANTADAKELSYLIPWEVSGVGAAEVSLVLPTGWRGELGATTPLKGVARVTGVPDRASNPVTVRAMCEAKELSETVSIPAPWRISDAFEFPGAYGKGGWQTNAVPPVARADVKTWHVFSSTSDYSGDDDCGGVDVWAVAENLPKGSAWVTRRVYVPTDRELKLVFRTKFWAADYGFTAYLDGQRVAVANLVTHSWAPKGERRQEEFPLKLSAGWHDLAVRADHNCWDHDFLVNLVDPVVGREPDDMRFDWTLMKGK